MSDELRNAFRKAQALQADLNKLGAGKPQPAADDTAPATDTLTQARDAIAAAEPLDSLAYSELAYRKAQALATIAQAEANRPRFVRLGDHTINVAQITYVDWYKRDHAGDRQIEITFCAVSNRLALGLIFRGDECEPVEAVLSGVLEPFTVASFDFPADADEADGHPFTVVE